MHHLCFMSVWTGRQSDAPVCSAVARIAQSQLTMQLAECRLVVRVFELNSKEYAVLHVRKRKP